MKGPTTATTTTPINRQPAQLYHPSIFTYTCRGRLSLNKNERPYDPGLCHGIQSQLEHVDYWRVMSKEEAIQQFKNKLQDSAAPGSGGRNDVVVGESGGKEVTAVKPIYLTTVLVYPEDANSNNSNNNSNVKKALAKSSTQEEWTCYGSTEVDLLVLRPVTDKSNPDSQNGDGPDGSTTSTTEDDQIVALSPFCSPGITHRDFTTPFASTQERTTTIRLAFMEILYSTTLDTSRDSSADRSSSKASKEDAAAAATATPTPSEMLERFSAASSKVLSRMQANAALIVEATQEDFGGRTYAASKKIVEEFPKTLSRTVGLMKRVLDWDDDKDD